MVKDSSYFANAFNTVQELIEQGHILSGHDISAGGMITTLLEMTFAENEVGLGLDLSDIPEQDLVKLLFSENPGIIIQVQNAEAIIQLLQEKGLVVYNIGEPNKTRIFALKHEGYMMYLSILISCVITGSEHPLC